MRVRVAAGVAFLVLLFVASELAMPRLAERRLRGELETNGDVRSVDVEAFPAVKLLFDRADRVAVRMASSRMGGDRIADLLADTRSADELDARIDVVRVGPLVLREVKLAKDGDRLHSEAALTQADLRSALPAELGLRPVETGGDGLVVEVSAAGLAVRARLSARDGALVIAPDGLLSAVATLTLFRDPRVAVTAVGARPTPDGFTVTADGRLTAA